MKKAIEVDKNLLEQCVVELERVQTFPNLSMLFESVASLYNTKGVPRKIKAGVVRLRIKEWNIQHKTKKGKRGNGLQSARAVKKEARISRGDKFKSDPAIMEGLAKLKKDYPEHKNKVKKIEDGSMKYALKMKCIDCCAGQMNEVRNCKITDCALWPFR